MADGSVETSISMPVGVVVRRTPGVTRWARHAWRAVAVLPGAAPATWRELRRDGAAVEFHAGTLPLTLYRSDVEAYRTALSTRPPKVYAILRDAPGAARGVELTALTASPFEAQDYTDSGEEIVEPVPMPPGLIAWIEAFVERHPGEDRFVKRRRDTLRVDRREDGKGDARIAQTADVYRSPASRKARLQ